MNSSISQILQVTAARADAKPQQPGAAQGEDFQRLLAQASCREARPPSTAETSEASVAEQSPSDNSEKDAATTTDDQSASTTDPLVLAAEAEEIAEAVTDELLLDEVELSEAAMFAVAAQLPPTTDYPVKVIEVTAAVELPVAVIDLPGGETDSTENSAKPQAAAEFAQTLQSQTPIAPAHAGVEVQIAAGENLAPDPTAEIIVDKLPQDPHPTEMVPETSLKPIQPTLDNRPAAPVNVKLPMPPQATTKPAAAAAGDVAPEATEEAEVVKRPARFAATEVAAPVKQEIAANEGAGSADKDSPVELRTPELQPVHHGRSEHNSSRSEQVTGAESGNSADVASDSDPVSTIDRARFVQRVSRAFQSAARDGVIQLRLSPPELGSLRIAIATHQGVLSAKVEADTAAARNIILDNLPALRERLAEQQIRLEKFDVDVRRDGGQDAGNWQADDRQPRNSGNSHTANRVRQSAAVAPRAARALGGMTDSGLDVRI